MDYIDQVQHKNDKVDESCDLLTVKANFEKQRVQFSLDYSKKVPKMNKSENF